jgi:adenylate kinase
MAAPLRVIVFGKQGSGKGTLATRLRDQLGIPHISTGDMLRAAAASGSEFGEKVAAIIDAGELVSDEVMEDVVRGRLAEADAQPGFILDGYPRTKGQAEFLDDLLAPEGISVVIELDVPDQVVVDRIVGRRICESCASVYAAGVDESAETGVCAKCGGAVVKRGDDTEAKVQKRLDAFREQTEPLLGYFSDQGLLERVDGVGDPDEIAAGVVTLIRSRQG